MSIQVQLKAAKRASKQLERISDSKQLLMSLADAIANNQSTILSANEKDLNRMERSDPRYDRLMLTEERLSSIAQDLRTVAVLPSPLGNILETRTLDNGLKLEKVVVPIGVIGIVYEARPNVTFDVFSICFKAGNSCVLKGGSDAADSNRAIVEIIREVLQEHNCPIDAIQLLPPDRSAVDELLTAVTYVDLIIPRGSKTLIDFVRQHSKVPVIETGAGVVHLYVDKSADHKSSQDIILNAKTRRVSVCNALDTLLVHRDQIAALPNLLAPLAKKNVVLFADSPAYEALQGNYPSQLLQEAEEEHYGLEFLDYKMSIRCVDGIEMALEHIAQHSSKHSEAILSRDPKTIEYFLQSVDAAVVYANASTAFTDGAQFGLGAEIGISTQKLPPRGPLSLREITTYKWKVRGNGQVRPS